MYSVQGTVVSSVEDLLCHFQHVYIKYRKPPKVSPWAYIRIKAIFDGLIFGRAYIRRGLYSERFWETQALPYSFVGMRAKHFLPLVSFSLRDFGGIAVRLIVSSFVSPFI